MKHEFTLLIADRNRNVREFLKRELAKEGYQVHLAKNAKDVLALVDRRDPLDLLILDLDLPDVHEVALLDELQHRHFNLPVVVHTYLADYAEQPEPTRISAFVEKQGSSIEELKRAVSKLLHTSTHQPSRALKGDTAGHIQSAYESK